MKINKQIKKEVLAYIVDSIDCSDYPNTENSLKNIFTIFYKEKGLEKYHTNKSFKELFCDWLQGLPSCLNVEYITVCQAKLLKKWGVDKKESTFEVFYELLATVFFEQFSYSDFCKLLTVKK